MGTVMLFGKQRWHGGESTHDHLPATNVDRDCIPELTPHVGRLCYWLLSLLQGFPAGFSGFPPSRKTNISKFQFNLKIADEEPLLGYATANSYLFIYLFIFISFICFGTCITLEG